MLHTGDHYETRARLERHLELRRLTRRLTGFVFGASAPETRARAGGHGKAGCANDLGHKTNRAA